MALLFGSLAIDLVLSSCGAPIQWQRVTINEPIKPEELAFIIPGRTTFPEILEKLGTPDEISGSKRGPVAHYRYLDQKSFRVDLAWPLRFFIPLFAIPVVSPEMSLRDASLGTDVFMVFLDSNWIVQEHAFARQAQSARFAPRLF
jgi:hypothetical protein